MLTWTLFSFFGDNLSYIILGISLCAIIILFIYRFKNHEEDEVDSINSKDLKFKNKGIDVNLKMQAYERLTIFLERTDPFRLLHSIDQSEKNIEKIEQNILKIVITEFEYNISQQVYVSDTLWNMILLSKNKTINLIHSVKNSLKKNSDGSDFFNALKLVLENNETTPSKITLAFLKKEVRSI